MNREEAIRKFGFLTKAVRDVADKGGPNQQALEEKAELYEMAYAALRGPQPDPITGLVPCGCGGKPEYIHSHPNINKGTYGVRCFDCDAMIGLYADNYCLVGDYAHKNDAKNAWNTSRGYTAPPRPGAIEPETGEMAPNGDEGAES